MRRLSCSLMTIAALLAATSAAAGSAGLDAGLDAGPDAAASAEPSPAQENPSAAPPAPTAQPAGVPAATVAATPDDKKAADDKKTLNPRLAPGGVLAGGSNAFPLRLTATLDTSVSNGILAPGYQVQPNVGNSLSLRPSASLPKADWLPKMLLNASVDFFVNNWLPAFTNSGVAERQIRVSDFGIGVVMPAAFNEELTGISITPVVSARLPLSITSRQQNLMTSMAATFVTSWNSPETPVGVFSVQYTPSLRGNVYTQDAPTIPCEAAVSVGGVVTDPLQQGDLPLAYAREAEVLPNGECILRGRQGVASIANNLAVAWSLSDHSVSLTLGHGLGFLRPLKNDPSLSSPFASGQNFNETTNGSVSYTYSVPVDFQLFLTAGISSSQPIYSSGNELRFPFYDFVTPANNFSAAFFDVSVGI